MGTRGLYGFRKDGVDKLTYNHFDSYPDCLGETMAEFCKTTSIKEMHEIFDRIVLVDEHDIPTDKQIKECIEYYNGDVSTGSPQDWYCLLRDAQGNPNAYKHGLKYMIDNHNFIKDSLFCEYAYIINLDEGCLEFYVGFQKEPSEYNRYGTEKEDNYYPCKMIAYYALDTNKTIEEIVRDMNASVDAEFNDEPEEEEERDITDYDYECVAASIQNGYTHGWLENGIEWRLEFYV